MISKPRLSAPASAVESREMYLESILLLIKENPSCKAKDLAVYMGFSRPSVSRALSGLEKSGMVCRDKAGVIALTERGKVAAKGVYDKHVAISDFFERIGVERRIAEKDACRFEHVVSQETFQRIKDFISGDRDVS